MDKDYPVKMDKLPGRINIDSKPITKIIVKCLICGNDVVIRASDKAPQVCEECEKSSSLCERTFKRKGSKILKEENNGQRKTN